MLLFWRKVVFLPGVYVVPWDLRYYHLPLAYFMAKCFRSGYLPLWDPYVYCGLPFHAVITTQLFYPPTLAAVLASIAVGGKHLLYFLELQIVLHVLLAGIFAYHLMLRLGVGRAAALVGATIFQLGPFFVSQPQHIGAINAGAWIPLALLALVALGEGFEWHWVAVLATALAMTILSGFPAVTATAYVACAWLVALLVLLRRARWTLAVSAAAGCAGSLVLAAVQLVPTLQLLRLSVARFRGDWLGTGGGHPLQALISLVHPNYYGSFQFDSMTWKHPWNMTWLYLYCGIAGLVCILVGALWRRNRYALVFALLTVIALFWMLGDKTPVGRTLFPLLPMAVRAPLYNEYALPFFALGMAVLAGLGAGVLVGERRSAWQAALVTVVAADLILVASGRPMNTQKIEDEPGVAYEHFDGYREIPETMRRLVNQTFPPARVDTLKGSINWAGDAAMFEVPAATGNDPLALERFMQVRLSFCQGDRWGRWYEISNLASPLIDLLNVRYVLTREPLDAELLRRARFHKVTDLPGQVVYENAEVLPRFFLVDRLRPAQDMASAVAALRAPDFDPRSEAVVEGMASPQRTLGRGTVKPVRYSPLEVVLEVDSAAPSYLVTSETHYPGWRAWVDSAEARLYMTNAAFRGLTVPAGRHTVTMRFSPPLLWPAAMLSGAAWLMLCVLSLRKWISRRRSSPRSTSSESSRSMSG